MHESCSAAIVEGDDIVYLARAATRRIMSSGLCIGTRLPAYCTAMGRVLLAGLPREDALDRLSGMERRRLTPFTRTAPDDLVQILGQVRTEGFCLVDQELEVGLISIAVPLYNTSGAVVAAINVASSPARVAPDRMVPRFLPPLLDMQRKLRPLIRA